MMKKLTALSLALCLLLLAGCGNSTGANAPASSAPASSAAPSASSSQPSASTGSDYDKQPTIKFGITAQVTGNNALTGEYVTNGATLAVDELNAKGGVLGKPVKLVIEDEGDDQQMAINACQKLLATDYISGFFGGLTSSYAVAMVPYVNKAKIPFMAGGSSRSIANQKSEYTWQPRLVDVYSSTAIAKGAVEALGMKKPAILYVNESFGISNYEGIVKQFKESGIEPAISLSYNVGEPQFSNMLSQIIASGADGLIAITTVPMDAATIMTQTHDMEFPLPCIGSNGFSMTASRGTAKEKSNGWYTVTDYSSNNTHPAGQEFEKKYQARFGKAGDLGAVSAYDSIMMMAMAAEKAGSADPAAINAELSKIKDYHGATADMTYDPEWKCFAQWEVLCINEDDGKTCRVVDTILK